MSFVIVRDFKSYILVSKSLLKRCRHGLARLCNNNNNNNNNNRLHEC